MEVSDCSDDSDDDDEVLLNDVFGSVDGENVDDNEATCNYDIVVDNLENADEIDHDNELEHDEIDYNSDESHVHADCEEILIGYEPSACGDNGSDSPIQTTELDAEISTDEFVTELDNNSMTSMNMN